jgi:amino acid transporter
VPRRWSGVLIRVLILTAVAIYVVFWARAMLDLARHRPDLSTSAKAGWAIIMLILPFVGLVLYTMLRPARPEAGRR